MIMAQAGLETRTLLRNGEQLLLTLIIPVLLLAAFTPGDLVKVGSGQRPGSTSWCPGIIALAVMSTAFTSQAIATGFERRYGVLKRLGATPLSRGGLIAAKTVTVIAVELVQVVIIVGVGLALGWQPHAGPARRASGSCPAGAGRHRRVQRAGAAAGRHAARRGDAGRWPTWSTWCCWASAGSSSR